MQTDSFRNVAAATLLAAGLTLGAAATAAEDAACAPGDNLRGDPDRGAQLHLEHCAQCHGADGRAEVIVLHMDVPPRDQTDVAYMKTLPDAFLYLAICQGGEAVGRNFVMPPFGDTLSDQDIRDLVAWVRSFSGT